MLIAGLGVVAALAFVLGLGAVCLWALKRWGAGALGVRTRVPVEVVQRIPLGPKTGLAVVRVGDKVMAVSIGDGGVRPLFELDEADRQRVIATSTIPLPLASSAEAAAAFAPLSPTALGSRFGSMLGKAIKQDLGMSSSSDVTDVRETMPAAFAAAAPAPVMTPVMTIDMTPVIAPFSMSERSEVPKFLTAPATTSSGTPVTYGPSARPAAGAAPTAADRDFRAMLGVSLSQATRLAVLVGAMVLVGASQLHAQQGPPTPPPAPAPAAGAATGATSAANGAAVQTATPAQPIVIQNMPAVQPLNLPPLVAPTRGAAGGKNSAAAAAPRTGNGAQVTAQGAASRREMNRVQLDSVAEANQKAQAASPAPIAADDAIMRMMPQMDMKLGGDGETGGLRLNGTVGIVVMMGLLTLLPTLLLMMTGFTRILIVLHFLKQAMGTQSAPPGQLLAALALLLTGFVMGPTLSQVNREAITPWLDGKITQVEMMKTGVQPMREFMLRQTRESDLKTFVELSRMPRPATVDDVPLHVLMSAFVASELRTAFQIGFAIYLPFIIIDAVVASVLMSMGMMMLPPAMISLPFKLLLFVLVDGWSLTITSLVQSFK